MPNSNAKFDKAVEDFQKILVEAGQILCDFKFKAKGCSCIKVYYKCKIFCTIKLCDFTTAEVLENKPCWVKYLECIRRNLCCFLLEHEKCCPIEVEQSLVKSYTNTNGETIYVIRLEISNKCDRKIKDLTVRDYLLKKDCNFALLKVDVDRGCFGTPVDCCTPDDILGRGCILDPRKSYLPPKAKIVVVYEMQSILALTNDVHLVTSHVDVSGRFVCPVTSKMILEPEVRAGNPRDLDSRTLSVPEDCILFDVFTIGKEGVQRTKIINGTSYTITLTGWVKKPGTYFQYTSVNYSMAPTNKGVIEKIKSYALLSAYTTYPNNTSGTIVMPLNTIWCSEYTYQTAFVSILFCIKPCVSPSITVTLDETECVVAGDLLTVATTVTGFPAPAVSYTLDGSPVALSGGQLDTTGLAAGPHVLAASASNTCGTASTSVTFNVVEPIVITALTSSPQNAFVGSNVTFSVTATGTGPLTYQWTKNYTAISGATSASYNINPVALADAGNYRVVVSNACGSVTSNAIVLNVTCLPLITAPLAASVAELTLGDSVTLNAFPFGTEPLTYLWSTDNGTIASPAAISTTATPASVGTATYTFVVTDPCSNQVTQTISVTVVPATTTTTTTAACVAPAAPTGLTATAVSTSQIDLAWPAISGLNGISVWRNGAFVAVTPGSGSATSYSDTSLTPNTTYSYRILPFNSCGQTFSNTAIATTLAATTTTTTTAAPCVAPVITSQPASAVLTVGQTAVFSVVATGTNLTYQWAKNYTAILGATSASYTINSVVSLDSGNYSVTVSNTCGTVTSNAAVLTVT